MTKEEIFVGLKEIIHTIKPNTPLDNVGPDSHLINDLMIDSLTMLLLSLAIEQKFHFEFSGPVHFQTVGEVMDFIAGKVS